MAFADKTSGICRQQHPLGNDKNLFWLGRYCLLRAKTHSEGGFVLPTAILMLALLTLIVGGLLARTISRTEQVTAQRNRSMLVNGASPGMERAKAKLDRMFSSFGVGFIPNDARLIQELRQDNPDPIHPDLIHPDPTNPAPNYSLSDETRLDLNGDGILDNAWSFESLGVHSPPLCGVKYRNEPVHTQES